MRRFLYWIGLVLLPILLWTIIASFTPRYLVARPIDVAALLFDSRHLFATDVVITLLESVGGLIVALIFSCITAIGFQLIPRLQSLIMPYAIALKSIPIVAIAPLLVLWFGNGLEGKIVLASLICFFPILVGLSDGMQSVPRDLHYLASVWSTGKIRTLYILEIPYAAPYLFSALKVAAPLAMVGAIVAEFSGADKGLGHAILVAAYRADTTLLFAGIILVSILGLILFSVVSKIEQICLRAMRVPRVFRPI